MVLHMRGIEKTLELERFPHIGGVTIGNNVEVCANSSIARGSLSDTGDQVTVLNLML